MHIDDLHYEPMPNKLIPGSFTQRTSQQDEIRKARESLAYWWYRCLSLNEGYIKCCEAPEKTGPFAVLFADMGDVREPFTLWWRHSGRKALNEQKPKKDVLVLTTFRQADDLIEDPNTLVLAVPLGLRKSTALRKIKAQLDKTYDARPPVDIWAASTAKRMIVKSKVRTSTIKQLIRLWELRQKFPDDSLYELGVRARLDLDLLARDTSGESLTQAMERRRMTIAVSRLLRQAQNLIENAGRGVFPDLKKHD
jgi:hypothetical protein